MKLTALQTSILQTVLYLEIFEYPPSIAEVYERLLSPTAVNFSTVKRTILSHPQLRIYDNFVIRPGNEQFVHFRKKRAIWSTQKQSEVQRIQSILQKIPFISAVYITGSLAMNNLRHPNDDIDVLVITKANRLWITRLVVIFITSLLKKYRLHDRRKENSWCFNLWLDEAEVRISPDRHSMYTAYEVVQAKQIVGSFDILRAENSWIKKFVPNASLEQQHALSSEKSHSSISSFLDHLNRWSYRLQLQYMNSRRTKEVVSLHSAFFHPRDTKHLILKTFSKKVQSVKKEESNE